MARFKSNQRRTTDYKELRISILGAIAIFFFTSQLRRVLKPSVNLTLGDFSSGISLVSGSDDSAGPKTKIWQDWPAVAYEEVGHPLVVKGDSFFNHARELYFSKEDDSEESLMEEFLDIYKERPDKTNLCGIRINHALALFLAVKQIQPRLVVESGVNAGQSTYIIRAASPTTQIFAIDTLDEPICAQNERWIDPSDKTTYYTGENFKDLLDFDWRDLIEKRKVDPKNTLVFIDDHLVAMQRIAPLTKYGIRHVIVEDNYKKYEGATNFDRWGTPKQIFNDEKELESAEWLFNNVASYAEFPPLVPPIMAKASKELRKEEGGFMVASDPNTDIVHPMLRPDINDEDMKKYIEITTFLQIDPKCKDHDSYMQLMNYNQIAYLELLPLAPMISDLF